MSASIKPRLAGGFNDYLPNAVLARRPMFETIQRVFERFGFVPLDTPCVELEEVLTGGDPGFSKNIFRIRGSENQPIALRFDLTVPLARVIAAYPELPKPFKRYQIGQVFRGEKPQAGRFRQFTQFDADIVGSNSVMADAEIVALMYEVMTELGFQNTLTRVNSRKILNGLAQYAGFPETKNEGVLRAIDKLDRDGWEAVADELTRVPDNQFDESALNLTSEQVAKIQSFVSLKNLGHEEVLAAVDELMVNSPIGREGTDELKEMIRYIRALGVPDDRWSIDLSVARGLGYYTGPVFETVLLDIPEIGSVFSGGRFDDLVSRFSGNSVPATGASVGVDRIFAAMQKLKLMPSESMTTEVLILNIDKSLNIRYLELSRELRTAGLKVEVYFGSESSIKGQLGYALNRSIPLVVFLGPDELDRGTIKVKDLRTRTQYECAITASATLIKSLLG